MKRIKFAIIVILISIIALGIRVMLFNYISHDMQNFVLVWINQLENNGGIRALGLEIGNYNIIYMTLLALLTYIPLPKMILVKMISVIFDFVIALAGAIIITDVIKNKTKKQEIFLISYGILLLIPSLILNSAMWGQCDSIYVAFIILSIMFLIKNQYIKSIIMLGIAFAFKLQTVFIFPLYGLIYLGKKKFPFYYFFIIPIVNFASWLPAMLNGRSIISCLNVYLGQTETIDNLITRNFVNIYNFILGENTVFIRNTGNIGYIGIILLAIIFLGISILVIIKKTNIEGELLFLIGIWGVVISTFLLPSMHERYLIIADVLSIIYIIIYKKNALIALGINAISIYLYYIFLTGWKIPVIPPAIMAILFLVIVIYLTSYVLYKIIQTNKESEMKLS